MTAASIRLYRTAEHPCGYWHDRAARDLVLDPRDSQLPSLYPGAVAMGFRRSGAHVYRPYCAQCQACVSVRIPVADFVPDRAQRKCARRNADLSVRMVEADRRTEHFVLYQRYLLSRHRNGGMDDARPADFDAFLKCAWSPTRFLEFRSDGRLVAVAVTDRLPEALSAVYTFFDPDLAARSLGTYAILVQLDFARRHGLEHLYLGYWIDGHPKMDYKRRFRPLEGLLAGRWTPIE
ncbi:MAG: arginyltransferase [Lysobacteraceae bacterium]